MVGGREQVGATGDGPSRPSLRSTRQKRAIAAALARAGTFRSAQDLHGELRARGERVGLTTVYNQLRALADAGELDVVRTDDGELRYRHCEIAGHHHHLQCRSCGTTVELEAAEVEAWTAATAARHGFVDVRHTVEITGRCAACAGRP